MPDEVQKTFVGSFIQYLKRQVESQTLNPDAVESIEVAIQCMEAAFDLGDDVAPEVANSSTPAATATPAAAPLDLFELFQSLYIERNPQSLQMAETIKNEGNRLMKDNKYNEALLQYNRAITFDPKNPIFYCNRAAAYIRLGDNERAVTDCKSALVYNANYGKAYGRLGIAYSNLGKYDQAQEAYAKAIELEPENQDYRNNLEVARSASQQAPLHAIPQLREGLNAMLSNPAIRNLFGSAEIDLDQLQQMSQNPMVMNAIGQMFTGMQGGGGGGGGAGGVGGGVGGDGVGGIPAMPNDMLQLFQSFATQLAGAGVPDAQPGGGSSSGDNNTTGGNQQQPPPSS